jgi:hypothetical protein
MVTMRDPIVALAVACSLALAASAAPAQTSTTFLPAERQIAAAVSTAPAELRADATVLGYDSAGKLVTLRRGTNDLICLADDPRQKDFNVACYYRALEPFMASGRALRAKGLSPKQVDSGRVAEIKAGRWHMPRHPTALYQYFASRDSVDQATGTVHGASYLYVVYTPYATLASTGLAPKPPTEGAPWLMFPGKPWAHIMIATSAPETIKLWE